MREPLIVIRTSWGQGLGMGHVQRMTALGWHLRQRHGITPAFWIDEAPSFMPAELAAARITRPPSHAGLIIRDMRDSSKDEIGTLKQTAPVLAVDDMGEGRALADHVLDLLPVPAASGTTRPSDRENLFIHGYTFVAALGSFHDREFEKTQDVIYYAGAHKAGGLDEFVISIMPEAASCAVFSGSDSYLVRGNARPHIDPADYVPSLLSSRVLVSHFGLTMYEARAAGCEIIGINPSDYHSHLCDIAPAELGIMNLGVEDRLDPVRAGQAIRDAVERAKPGPVRARDVYAGALKSLDSVTDFLRTIVAF
jgi:hypothetical protein